jgi:integrase
MARDKGSGSIYQRKSDRRWFAQITVDGKTKSKSSMDQAIVKRWLKDTIRESHQGTFVVGKTPTVAAYLDDWLAGRSVSARTRVSYETSWTRIIPYIGDVRLDRLTEGKMRAMWRSLEDGRARGGQPRRPLALTTLRTTYTHLNAALATAVKNRAINLQCNPAEDAKPRRPEHQEMHPLTEDEVKVLLTATRDDPEYPMWLVLITTGLRVGELIGLKRDDIAPDRTTISVRRTAHRLKGQGIVEASTKTKKGRLVDMPRTTGAVLGGHLERQAVRSLRGYVFTMPAGTPIDPRWLGEQWHKALAKAGLAQRKLHNTRHTYATLLFAKGEHPKVVQEQMGHSSIKLTLDIYSAYIPTMGRSAAERLETVLA